MYWHSPLSLYIWVLSRLLTGAQIHTDRHTDSGWEQPRWGGAGSGLRAGRAAPSADGRRLELLSRRAALRRSTQNSSLRNIPHCSNTIWEAYCRLPTHCAPFQISQGSLITSVLNQTDEYYMWNSRPPNKISILIASRKLRAWIYTTLTVGSYIEHLRRNCPSATSVGTPPKWDSIHLDYLVNSGAGLKRLAVQCSV